MVVVVGLVCLFFVLIGLQRDIGRNALSQNQEVCVQLLFRGINQISSVFFFFFFIPLVDPHESMQKHQGKSKNLTFI